jgi:VIT family
LDKGARARPGLLEQLPVGVEVDPQPCGPGDIGDGEDADGFSMGASNYLARRSTVESPEPPPWRVAARYGAATFAAFILAGLVPLIAYLLPLDDDARFPAAIALTATTLFVVGAGRSLVTRRGFLRSGGEMLLVGSSQRSSPTGSERSRPT